MYNVPKVLFIPNDNTDNNYEFLINNKFVFYNFFFSYILL